MKIAIYGNKLDNEHSSFITKLITALVENHFELYFFEKFANFLHKQKVINNNFKTFTNYNDLDKNIDIMISVGGDGTFLRTASIVRDSNIPIVGVNTGTLGFLAHIKEDDIENFIKVIVDKSYFIEERTLLILEKPKLEDEITFALNDITIHKKDTASAIIINTYINEDIYLTSYWGDGLIISTPTGSTAYSMSVGGPIITPNCENIIISPISSHNLSVRPIVIADTDIIKLKIEGRTNKYLLSVDSNYKIIDIEQEIIIKKANFKINVLSLKKNNFFDALKSKLLWGIDKRIYK